MKITQVLSVFLVGLTVLAWPGSAAVAHPHVWIDLKTEVIMDDQGRITGLRLDWTMDELYSTYVIEDMKLIPDVDEAKELAAMARVTQENLGEYNYFVRVKLGDEVQNFSVIDDMRAEVRDDLVWMGFTIGFDQPIDLSAGKLRYAVYDPTYYIEITYPADVDIKNLGATPISFSGGPQPDACQATVTRAEPTFETIALAASLDREDVAPVDLGDLFAEWVGIDCPAK